MFERHKPTLILLLIKFSIIEYNDSIDDDLNNCNDDNIYDKHNNNNDNDTDDEK